MKPNLIKTAFLLAFTAFFLNGCGGDSTSGGEKTDSTKTTTEKPGTKETPAATGIQGTYEWRQGSGENEAYGVLKIAGDQTSGYNFSIIAGYRTNSGYLGGTLKKNELDPNVYNLKIVEPSGLESDCSLAATIKGEMIKIQPVMEGLDDCGAGLNVSFNGDYKRTSSENPKLDDAI